MLANSSAPGSIGTASAFISAVKPLPSAISRTWPIRPKPVISVQEFTSYFSMDCCAFALRAVMAAIRDFSYSPERSCAFAAVVSTPLPIAFVSMRRSPSFAEELESTLSGLTNPVTASPYFGSGSSMVWPPQSMAPASSTLSAPPASIAFMAS